LRCIALITVLLLPSLATGAVPLRSFDTVIGVQRDGSVVIVEKFVPETIGAKLVWSTSTEYPGVWSIHSPRVVKVLQVTTADGHPLAYSLRRGVTRLDVEIQTSGAQTFRIVYSVRNAVRFLSDHDELIWHSGEGWRGETGTASVFVQVPPEVKSAFRAQTYVSGQGLLPAKETDAGPDRVWFESPTALMPQDRFVTDVVLPKGILQEPTLAQRTVWFIRANLILLLPIVTLITMLVLRALKKIPAAQNLTVETRYEPPNEFTPAEVGVLLDDRLDPRDVTATLIDLAVRGYIKLERCKPDAGVAFEHQDFAIRCVKPKESWTLLKPHERTLLFHTFYGGEWTKLSSLTLRFYAIVPVIQQQVLQLLRTRGMYWTDPAYAPAARVTMLGIFLFLAFLVQVAGLYSFATSWLLSAIAIFTSAGIVYYFGRGITSKTLRGLSCDRQILGFQEFLNSVERDRLERMPGQLFERWLPHAMALGVDQHWARQFEGMALPPPEWLEGIDEAIFSSSGLAHVLGNFERQARSTLFVMPRSAESRPFEIGFRFRL
jgi:hypothetical protein